MSRISFSEVDALPDILDVVAFELLLGVIPGAGSSRHLTLKCTTANIPGFSNERFTQILHGHALNFRGNKKYPQTLSVNYVEDSTFATQYALLDWHERIAGSESNNSAGYKSQYSVGAQLIVYDTTGAVAARHSFESLFIQDVPDVSLTGDASAAMQVPCTFSYDRFIPGGRSVL